MLAFFDKSYCDLSLKTRVERQYNQIKVWLTVLNRFINNKYWLCRSLYNKVLYKIKHSENKVIDNKCDNFIIIKSSMDLHIQEKGGIVDNMGNVHTTANSYKQYLKDNNLVIRDWTHGTLSKPEMKLAKKEDIMRTISQLNIK